MEHEDVRRWVASYEGAWRSAATTTLPGLFTEDVSYSVSPWASAIEGMAALEELWEAERDGPDESFEMSSEIVAVDGGTAVVRVEVDYAKAGAGRWRDLWVLRFEADGRCSHFEEWPFAPTSRTGTDTVRPAG